METFLIRCILANYPSHRPSIITWQCGPLQPHGIELPEIGVSEGIRQSLPSINPYLWQGAVHRKDRASTKTPARAFTHRARAQHARIRGRARTRVCVRVQCACAWFLLCDFPWIGGWDSTQTKKLAVNYAPHQPSRASPSKCIANTRESCMSARLSCKSHRTCA